MAMRLLPHRNIGIFLENARYACIFKLLIRFPGGTEACFLLRISLLAALAAGIWLLAAIGAWRPVALGLDAPANEFSAARADAVLGRLLDGQRPRPAGSADNAVVRGRILKELAALNVPARTDSRMSCYGERRFG